MTVSSEFGGGGKTSVAIVFLRNHQQRSVALPEVECGCTLMI